MYVLEFTRFISPKNGGGGGGKNWRRLIGRLDGPRGWVQAEDASEGLVSRTRPLPSAALDVAIASTHNNLLTTPLATQTPIKLASTIKLG